MPTVTWSAPVTCPAKVTQIVQAVVKVEGMQLASPTPLTSPAPQMYFLPQRWQGDAGLGAAAHTWALACRCTLTETCVPIQLQGPAWHRGLP